MNELMGEQKKKTEKDYRKDIELRESIYIYKKKNEEG